MGLGTLAVTGVAGNIGSVVREALRGEAARLILLDRVPMRPETENEEVHTIDLRDAAAVESALAGADRVLHLGGVPDEAPLPDLLEANALATHHALEAARRTGMLARMKTWKILRDCRLKGDGMHTARCSASPDFTISPSRDNSRPIRDHP
jgi:nucleoside-diphosphate-sugar epimerase